MVYPTETMIYGRRWMFNPRVTGFLKRQEKVTKYGYKIILYLFVTYTKLSSRISVQFCYLMIFAVKNCSSRTHRTQEQEQEINVHTNFTFTCSRISHASVKYNRKTIRIPANAKHSLQQLLLLKMHNNIPQYFVN